MRKAFSEQRRLDGCGVAQVQFSLNRRDEIIPVLRSVQQIYSRPELRDQILDLVAADVNRDDRDVPPASLPPIPNPTPSSPTTASSQSSPLTP